MASLSGQPSLPCSSHGLRRERQSVQQIPRVTNSPFPSASAPEVDENIRVPPISAHDQTNVDGKGPVPLDGSQPSGPEQIMLPRNSQSSIAAAISLISRLLQITAPRKSQPSIMAAISPASRISPPETKCAGSTARVQTLRVGEDEAGYKVMGVSG